MSARSVGLVALGAVSVLLAGGAWVGFGSAATLTVTPRAASAFRTCVLTAYPPSTASMIDTWTDENVKNAKHGNGTFLQIQSRSGKNTRAYLRFDLTKCAPTIAGTATVKTATVRLALLTAPSASRTYTISLVTGPCPEAATTCWNENGLTWNNKPTVAASATSSLNLTSSSAVNQYYAFDVTADAAAMVAGTVSNYGWRIADSAEGNASGITVTFKAKEALLNAARAPQLVLVYLP